MIMLSDAATEMIQLPIGVCILNWNTAAETLRCVQSVIAQTLQPTTICVLDNDSIHTEWKALLDGMSAIASGQLSAVLKSEDADLLSWGAAGLGCHQLLLLRSSRNLGFAGGINRIVKYFEKYFAAEYYLLLNSDAILGNDLVGVLIEAVRADESIGVAGATNWSLEDGGFLEGGICYNERLAPARVGFSGEESIEVDKVIGASMLVRAECYRSVGGLNEQYFLYFEDDEFCLAAKRNGYRVVYVPKASLLHSRHGTSNAYVRRYFLQRNKFLFAARNSERRHVAANWLRRLVSALRTLLSLLLKHRDLRAASAQYWAIFDACNCRWGKRRFAALIQLATERKV